MSPDRPAPPRDTRHAANAASAGNATKPPAFFFVAGNAALDLLNTTVASADGIVDLLGTWSDVVAWARGAGVVSSVESRHLADACATLSAAQHALASVVAWRERVRSALRDWTRTGTLPRADIAFLNEHLKQDSRRPTLTRDGQLTPRGSPAGAMTPAQLLADLSLSAAQLFTATERARVRPCEHPDCVLWFLDTSRGGQRRWCSMAGCGNRAKVAAFAQRARG